LKPITTFGNFFMFTLDCRDSWTRQYRP